MSLIEQEPAAPPEGLQSPQNLSNEVSSFAILGADQFKYNAAVHNQIGSGVAELTPEVLDAALGRRALEFLASRKAEGAEDQLFVSPIVGDDVFTLGSLAEMCARRGEMVRDHTGALTRFDPAVHNNHAPEGAQARAWILLRDKGNDDPAYTRDTASVQMMHLDKEGEREGVKLTTPTLADVLMADLVRMEAGQSLLGARSDVEYRLGAYPGSGGYTYLPQTEATGDRREISQAFHARMGEAGLYRAVEAPLL